MTDRRQIEIFSDYIWPWCYFITGSIERIQEAFDIDIRWTAFPLHPDTPEEGKTLEELFKGRNVDIDQVMARLKQVASGLELPFGDRKMTYNSRLAQELAKWAELKDKGNEFHNAVFRAYFVDGKNIGKADVLVEVAESVDLSGKDALKVIQNRTYREAVDLDWRRSRELRITAVPTFLFNHQLLVGAQKYEKLEKLMLSNKVKRRTSDNTNW